MSDVAIRCEGLTRRFGKVVAVDNLNLEVRSGSVFGFLGPNGAGKTTTIKLLTGLLHPTSGRAFIAGEEIQVERVRARGLFGYLPEDPVFYGWMTARELLAYAGHLFGIPDRVLKPRAEELLDLAGLKPVADRKVGGFSRGMRQRLGLAQALVNNPPVLILDEPASALDPVGRHEVLALIQRLRARDGITIFMSTHILADVERTCDTVAIIDRGRLLTVADQDELRRRYAVPVFTVVVAGEEADIRALHARLQSMPWADHVERSNDTLRVFAGNEEAARRELPAVITASPVILLRYEVGMSSLEDAFLRVVGREPAKRSASGGV
ncbi:MAG: ABC transporter ATP-binding protein [Anaerolineales bacterium]